MIGSSENRVSYNGNGSAKEFAFEFKILNASDIKVLLVNADGTEKLLTKDYFVDIEKSVVRYPGYAPGAELPLEQQPPILPIGSKLVLYREVPITQQTKLDQFWPFNVIEAALDKLTIICQQLSDGFSRCLKLSESVPKDVNPTIPVEAGKSFRWGDDGKKIVLTDDPAKVLPQANDVLKRTEAARDVAIAKADAAGASAVSAAESEVAADRSATQAEAAKVAAKASETAAKTSETNAKASETKAKTSETNAGKSATTATTKASEASVSATNAKASETAAKTSETNAKASEGKAKTSETNAGTSATTATQQATKATTEANRAKTEADRAKIAADSVGNPVVSITQSDGNLTVTKGDGSSDTLTVTPAKASQAEAEAGTDDTKMMTPLRTKQAVIKLRPLYSGAAAHNSIYRGKSLGSSVTAEQWNAIKAGTFDDLYIGDYWTIGGVDYVIAAFDYYLDTGDTVCTKHHVTIVPRKPLYNHVMNDTNIVTGAYIGSKMYKSGLNQAKTIITNAFGSSHILTIRQLYTTTTNPDYGFGTAFAWQNDSIFLMNEVNIYGCYPFTEFYRTTQWGSDKYSIDNSQYPIFAFDKTMIHTRQSYWLRNVAYSTVFASVSGNGHCANDSASTSNGVRPAFNIYQS